MYVKEDSSKKIKNDPGHIIPLIGMEKVSREF
jgi:hypothetical protein